MRQRSPSARWTSEHGRKIAHRTPITAWIHALRINFRYPWEQPRFPYPCRWGQWYRHGETARKHWHVGRRARR